MGRWMKIQQKRDLIKKAHDCPHLTQHELADWTKAAFKLKRSPAQTTISDILRKASAILSDAYGDGRRRKPLEVTSMALETRLWEWIQQVEAQSVCLSRELITMKALDLQKELCDAWELSFSAGWLSAFERRHDMRSRRRQGEAASADASVVHRGLQDLQALTDQYDPWDIYNMDESGLCYAMAPVRSICAKAARGVKANKTRITVAFTANADGSHALPPLFIGRAKQPRCFKKRTGDELGFEYRSNESAWMTGRVFQEWLLKLDLDMRASGRQILLLLDNASSHKVGDNVCSNVRVEFLPPNTTAFLQPMDAGIIATFKQLYRRKQLIWVYDKLKRGEKIDKKAYHVNQLQAMQWSKEIWKHMQQSRTIENCFRHTGIVFNGIDERSSNKVATCYGEDIDMVEIIVRASQWSL